MKTSAATSSNRPTLQKLTLHRVSKVLDVQLSNGQTYALSAEYLRVHSPSAEVRGHGKPQLQTGKQLVGITDVKAVGHYGARLCFDDGHDTGLYTWPFLIDLCLQHDTRWQSYLSALESAGASRNPHESAVRWMPTERPPQP